MRYVLIDYALMVRRKIHNSLIRWTHIMDHAALCEGPIQSQSAAKADQSARVVGGVSGTAHLGDEGMQNLKKIICSDCKSEVQRKSPNHLRCHSCAESLKKETKKKYAKEWIKKSKKSGKNCSRCGKPTGEKGCCKRCLEYVREWKKESPLLVKVSKDKRKSEHKGRYWTLLYSLLLKQKGKCALCGVKAEKWHLDHKIPVSLGGCSEDFNFQVLCVWCNLHKGAKI